MSKEYVKRLSSRAKVTNTSAYFNYSYGDFSQKPEAFVDRYFDVMVYEASFGSRQLLLRFPKGAVDPDHLAPYCVPHLIEISTTKKSLILNINLNAEDYYTWISGDESWVDDLSQLRSDILQGDFRSLYLSWLRTGFAENGSSPAWETFMEPPIPPNLKKLSPALTSLTEFFMIDADMMAVAASESASKRTKKEPITDWIAALPERDRNAYLLRVVQGETHVGAELMEQTKAYQQDRKSKEKATARKARQQYLKSIASETDQLWGKVFQLIELKQAKPYDEAVEILKDLRDLAKLNGEMDAFSDRIDQIMNDYTNRPAFIRRIHKAQF